MTALSRWRAALAVGATSAVLTATPLVGVPTAYAAPYPPTDETLGLSDTVVEPGDPITFEGAGFESVDEIESALFSRKVVLGQHIADINGRVVDTVTIPKHIPPGRHEFRLTAVAPEHTVSVWITVHKDRPNLANTGEDDSTALLGGAGVLVLVGGGAVLAARRLKRR
ncbi:LPXTG cell wall anchor domain-containing protein [Streptomyces sp. NPDC050658]|uniref:LPXTG cell wall anchor domain-containing protein n=1 Tax=unclassified Streptomyces TaxID=2593676 RepID=UPI003417BD6E